MPDGTTPQLTVKTGIDATQVDAGAAKTEAALKKIVVSEAEVEAAAKKLNVSTDLAREALEQLAHEKNAKALNTVKDALRETTEETANVGTAAKAAADDVEEGGARFNTSVFENRRNVGHLVRGLLEFREGGISSFAGIGAEAHIASEALEEFLGPVGVVIGMVGLLTSVAIPLFEQFSKKDDKTAGLDAIKDGLDAAKTAADDYAASLQLIVNLQKDQMDQDATLLANAKARSALAAEDAKQAQEAAAQKLQAQHLLERSAATTDEQRKRIDDKYTAAQADLKGTGTVHSTQAALKDAQDEAAIAQKKADDSQAELGRLQQSHDQLKTHLDEQADFMATNRLSLDEKGKLVQAKDHVDNTHVASLVNGGMPTAEAVRASTTQENVDPVADAQKLIGATGDIIRTLQEKLKHPLSADDERFGGGREGLEERIRAEQVTMQKAQDFLAKVSELPQSQKEITDQQANLATAISKIDAKQDELLKNQNDLANITAALPQKQNAASLAQNQAALDKKDSDKKLADDQNAADQADLKKARDNELQVRKLRGADVSKEESRNKANDDMGIPVHGPQAALNPYAEQVRALNIRIGQLQDEAARNPDAAQYGQSELDAANRKLNGYTDEHGNFFPGASQQFDQFNQQQAVAGSDGKLTPEQLKNKSIRDLQAAQEQQPQPDKGGQDHTISDADTQALAGIKSTIQSSAGNHDALSKATADLADLAAKVAADQARTHDAALSKVQAAIAQLQAQVNNLNSSLH